MKRCLILMVPFLLTVSKVISQNVWMTRNLTNVPLRFLTHKDSIPNLLTVNNGMVFLKSDSVNLKDLINDYYESSGFYQGRISTYLLNSAHINNGLYITLDFINDRLFRINLFTDESYYLSNIKLEINRHFKRKKQNNYYRLTTDSTINRVYEIVSYGERYSEYNSYGSNKHLVYNYFENIEKGSGYLRLTDKKILERIPSWCGNSKSKNTWNKLYEYIDKNSNI